MGFVIRAASSSIQIDCRHTFFSSAVFSAGRSCRPINRLLLPGTQFIATGLSAFVVIEEVHIWVSNRPYPSRFGASFQINGIAGEICVVLVSKYFAGKGESCRR